MARGSGNESGRDERVTHFEDGYIKDVCNREQGIIDGKRTVKVEIEGIIQMPPGL